MMSEKDDYCNDSTKIEGQLTTARVVEGAIRAFLEKSSARIRGARQDPATRLFRGCCWRNRFFDLHSLVC